jgi:glycerol-3-phosphate acyltransferase PlsX
MIKIWLDVMWWDSAISWKTWIDSRISWWLKSLKLAPEMKLYLIWNEELVRNIVLDKWSKVDTERLDFVDVQEWTEIYNLVKQIKGGTLDWWVSAWDTWKLIKESIRLWRLQSNWQKFTPALTNFFPKQWWWQTLVLDLWATLAWFNSPQEMLNSYINNALLAIAYYKSHWKKSPNLWIFNIWTEDYKWPKNLQEVYKEFKEQFWDNFIWNVEWDKLLTTDADIVVTDAFTWNMVLKSIEGTVKVLSKEVKNNILKSKIATWLTLLLSPYFKDFKNQYNPDKYAWAPILWVNWNIFKSHWSSNSESITSAVLRSYEYSKNWILDKTKENLWQLTSNL